MPEFSGSIRNRRVIGRIGERSHREQATADKTLSTLIGGGLRLTYYECRPWLTSQAASLETVGLSREKLLLYS